MFKHKKNSIFIDWFTFLYKNVDAYKFITKLIVYIG